ncbi:MAG TPA: cupin domain-containing protein [Bryobacteraceae bacterium]|nr:cupin domain-containing protein [Bryobacteraceae bacterium]
MLPKLGRKRWIGAFTAGCGLLLAAGAQAESVRVIKFSEGKPFKMGEVTSMRIVHPDLGAKKTTLNYSVSKPGAEFAQHVHDESDDTILVLQGEVDLRQGDSLHRFRAGECAFVPAGQIHGTVTAGTGEATMISFQNPPDLVLYTGARDSKKPGAAAPKGVITPGAVKYLTYNDKNGPVTSPAMGSERGAFTHRKMNSGDAFKASIPDGGEQLFFLINGSIAVRDRAGTHQAGMKDTVFITGPAEVEVTAASAGTLVVQVEAPPGPPPAPLTK